MLIDTLAPGDIIYAASDIINDGSLPGLPDEALIAEKDRRGVIINTGHLEDNPDKVLVLVRFETGVEAGALGPAVACWPEELYIPVENMN